MLIEDSINVPAILFVMVVFGDCRFLKCYFAFCKLLLFIYLIPLQTV